MLGLLPSRCVLVGLTLAPPPSPDSPGPPRSDGPDPAAPKSRTIVVPSRARDLEDQEALDETSPGFARSLPVDPARDPTPADDLGRVLQRAPGVRVRSLGGLGQFSGVQIRGSSPQQVQIFLEGVPIGDSYGGIADVAGTPLDGLDRIEVYRGYIPVAFGGATLGGAINLVGSADLEAPLQAAVSGGYGSFRTREAAVSLAVPFGQGRWRSTSLVSYGGSAGDFTYFDDGGTPRIPDDDQSDRRRVNNDYDRVFAMARVDGRAGRTRVSQQVRATWREHGVAGPSGTQTSDSRQSLSSVRSVTRIDTADFGRPGTGISWVGGLSLGHRRFRDPLGQVGVGTDDQTTRSIDGYLSPRLRIPLWPGGTAGFVGEFRGEAVDVDEWDRPAEGDLLASGDAVRSRVGVGVGVELEQRLFDERWHLVPAARVDALASRFAVPPGEGEVGDEGRDRLDFAASPRLGTRIRFARGAELRGSIGRYFRAPTMFELFGDRGYVVGNEGLRPETGWSGDLGAVYRLRVGWFRLYTQVAGFASRSRDLIQFLRSGPVVRPANLEGARQLGVDGFAELRFWGETLSVGGEYTFLDSRNLTAEVEQTGEPLPGRPRHEGSARADVGQAFGQGWTHFEPRLGYRLDGVSAAALDLSGRYRLPARVLHGLVFGLHWARGVHLGLEVRNLADLRRGEIVPVAGPPDPVPVPISDYIGYPLPGRSFFVRLTVDTGLLDPLRAPPG